MPQSFDPSGRPVVLTHFAGRAGDHNDRGMVGSRLVASGLADRLGPHPVVVGAPRSALSVGWEDEFATALPELQSLSDHLDQVLSVGAVPITAVGRCAVALATLPVLAIHRPEAVVVWFDAHADLNTPHTTPTGYLGGMALSGPLGLWCSGLGDGLTPDRVVLVGTRDIDAPEHQIIDEHRITVIPPGPGMADTVRHVVRGRPVYVHLDCDVLEAGTMPTDYQVPGGMTLTDLLHCAHALVDSQVVGVQIGEFESDTEPANTPDKLRTLLDVLAPLLAAAASTQRT